MDSSDAKNIEGLYILKDSKDSKDDEFEEGDEPYDNAFEAEMGGEEMIVEYDDDYYEGKINVDDQDYEWNYRRSGAVSLVTSAFTIASVATTLF